MKKYFKQHKRFFLLFVITVSLVVLDLLTKVLTEGIDVKILGNFFAFISYHNTGAAWGSFSNSTLMLTIISALMCVGIFIFNYFYKQKGAIYYVAFCFVVSGAIGNLIDRIFLGYVRDFISFSCFNFIFNLADLFLTVGVVMLIVHILFFEKHIKVGKNGTN